MKKQIVLMKDIKKNFGEIAAIKKGFFDLYEGEIHSLIGENGAGKSTMMKILYGLYTKSSGEFEVKGKKYEDEYSTKTAIELGIGMVHQEFMLVKEMTVLENIILGFEPKKTMNRIDFAMAKKSIEEYIEKYNLDVQINKKIQDISVGEAQRVEIIKTLYRGVDILILDEPTAVLTPQETEKLFIILENLKKSGKSIIFISHKLNEVMKISDRITVMRQSKYINTVLKSETNPVELAKMMVGREVFLNIEKTKANVEETLLEVNDIYVSSDRELSKIRGISFDVKRGEIVGIAGVDGNGQSELIEAITGIREVEKGDVKFRGTSIKNSSVKVIRNAGIAHIPEDRNKRGLNRDMNIEENLVATRFYKKEFSGKFILDYKKIRNYAVEAIKKFDIRPDRPEISTKSLSGGNAQKIIVARELGSESDLLIASQPTRGIDIGSIEFIRQSINEYKNKGKGILLVSAELEEVMSLSDRIIVMYEGGIAGILSAEEATEESVGFLMTGGNKADEHEK